MRVKLLAKIVESLLYCDSILHGLRTVQGLGDQLVNIAKQFRVFTLNAQRLLRQFWPTCCDSLNVIARVFFGEVLRELVTNLPKDTHDVCRGSAAVWSAAVQDGGPRESKHDVKTSMFCEEVLDGQIVFVVAIHG